MVHPLRHISPRTRIVFVGLALVLVPGLFLSYLGLRSVNEKADTIRTSAQATLGLLGDKIEGNGTRIEEHVQSALIKGLTSGDLPADPRLWLSGLELANPALSAPVLVAGDESMISRALSYTPERDAAPAVNMSEVFRRKFSLAEEAEYRGQNLQEARNLYAQTMTKSRSSSERALAIARGGRCSYKLGEYANGIGLYNQLLGREYRTVTVAGIPAPVIALSEIADGYASLKDSASSRSAFRELRKLLIEYPWDLHGGSYTFYLALASKATQGENLFATADTLAPKEVSILKQARVMGAVTEYNTRTKWAVGGPVSPSILHIAVSKTGWPPTISYLKIPSTLTGQTWRGLAFLPDHEYLVNRFFPDILNSIDLGGSLVAGVVDADGSLVAVQDTLKTKSSLVSRALSGLFEGWSVVLLDREGRSIDELVAAEKRFYLLLLIGTAVIMLCGFFITIRAAVNEMETARLKTEFVSNVSHELKTPLSLIRMFSETLDSEVPVSQGDRQEFIGIIRRESERLTHLINNILDFSRMDSGKRQYHVKLVDAVEIVGHALDTFRFQLQESKFTLATSFPDRPLNVNADPEALSQAVLNLIDNAIKYSPERKAIRAEVRANGNAAVIVIEDEGIGIPPGDLQHVFERFYRVSSDKTRQIRGSGLGLSLAREVVVAHGGKIAVESRPDKGSTFTISIPLAGGMA